MGIISRLTGFFTMTSDEASGQPEEPSGRTDAEGSLYECASCEVVYIAIEKDHCSRCGDTVDLIESHAVDQEPAAQKPTESQH